MGKIKKGSVSIGVVAMPFPESWEFNTSLFVAGRWDYAHDGPLNDRVPIIMVNTGPSLAGKRNLVVKAFLETDSEWLLFVDTDQDFDGDLPARMLESADAVERPVLSALIMAERDGKIAPACTVFVDGRFKAPQVIPSERHWNVATVGTGCVLIHRSVFEKVAEGRDDDAFPWFKHDQFEGPDGKPSEMSEDYVFSLRCQAADIPLTVDTSIEVGHVKKRTLTTRDFYAQPWVEPPARRSVAIIPTKGHQRWVKALTAELADDPACDEVVIVDNGCNSSMRRWLDGTGYTIIDGRGMGIHEMWNAGAAHALSKPGHVDLFFLNDDVELSAGATGVLREALAQSDDLVAVCPNYDGRDGAGIERLHGVCGEKYDGTGGLAGFAFMVKSELFTLGGYAFPEQAMWWYGDTDLLFTIEAGGGWYGMVHACQVEHLGGGGNTGKWDDPAVQRQLAADQAWFQSKWAPEAVSA